jgi:hypothetical protein
MHPEYINITDNLKLELNKVLNLAPNATIEPNRRGVVIGIEHSDHKDRMAFASDISMQSYSFDDTAPINFKINFGSSGSFTPENKASYWRTLHASEVLKNWDVVCEILTDYINALNELRNE